MAMKRTTIMADEKLLKELRAVARLEGVSLAEVIRQGLEWRLRTRRRIPSFLDKLPEPSGITENTAARDEEIIADYVRRTYPRH
jgi:Ribbon-helix-helix protein, copG family